MVNQQVGRNDPCPCGSGKKYKKCCISKDAELFYLDNFQGQEIVFDDSFVKRDIIEIKQIFNDINSRMEFDIVKGLKLLKEIYKKYGELHDRFSPIFTCSKGCSYCCYPNVTVMPIEAELIRNYVLDHFNSDRQSMIINQINEQKENYISHVGFEKMDPEIADKLQNEYLSKQIPCPFLIDCQCIIYAVRPFVCRAMATTAHSDKCKNDEEKMHFDPYNINNVVPSGLLMISKKVFGSTVIPKHLAAFFINGFEAITIE